MQTTTLTKEQARNEIIVLTTKNQTAEKLLRKYKPAVWERYPIQYHGIIKSIRTRNERINKLKTQFGII